MKEKAKNVAFVLDAVQNKNSGALRYLKILKCDRGHYHTSEFKFDVTKLRQQRL